MNTGTVEVVNCMWHQAQFDLASGASLDLEIDKISIVPVEVVDGEMWVNPEPSQKVKTILGSELKKGCSGLTLKERGIKENFPPE